MSSGPHDPSLCPAAGSMRGAVLGIVILLAALAVTLVGSLALGSRQIPIDIVIDALSRTIHGIDVTTNDGLIMRDMRLPRTAMGLVAGLALGARPGRPPGRRAVGWAGQRVWIAMALAQQTNILLLDEPTSFLDITHQIEVLDLIHHLNADERRTVVVVLHDLNLACRYAHHLVAMRDGAIIASGSPETVITAEIVRDVFGLDCVVIADPVSHTPLVVPVGVGHRAGDRRTVAS